MRKFRVKTIDIHCSVVSNNSRNPQILSVICYYYNPLELHINFTYKIFNIINTVTEKKCDPLVHICGHFTKYSCINISNKVNILKNCSFREMTHEGLKSEFRQFLGLLKSVASFTGSQINSVLNRQTKDCTCWLGLNPSIGRTLSSDSDLHHHPKLIP
jgi:hypothetical protein